MSVDMEKFGVSQTDINNAALGDFDDYVPEKVYTSLPQPKNKQEKRIKSTTEDPVVTPNKKETRAKVSTDSIVIAISKEKTTDKDNANSPKTNNVKASESVDVSTGFLGNLYIISFIKNLFTKQKAGVCIWLIINMIIVMLPLSLPSASAGNIASAVVGAFAGLGIYLLSLILALSPIGEAILRWQNKCKKIKNPDIASRIVPLFDEVYDQARTKDHSISDNVGIFMSPDESPNAFATGRKTICVTEGLLNLSDNDIKAVLAHEFGHLAHKDTDVILAVTVGNMFFSGFMIFINLFINACLHIANFIIKIFSDNNGSSFSRILYRVINFIFFIIMFVWTKLGVLICMHSNRKGEISADLFAVDLGYCEDLANALLTIDNGDFASPRGLWASLHSSHPETADRISEMNKYNAQLKSR